MPRVGLGACRAGRECGVWAAAMRVPWGMRRDRIQASSRAGPAGSALRGRTGGRGGGRGTACAACTPRGASCERRMGRAGVLAAAVAAAAVSVRGQPGQWTLTWEDDFSAPTLNTSWWNVANNMTHGDREWQLYLNDEVRRPRLWVRCEAAGRLRRVALVRRVARRCTWRAATWCCVRASGRPTTGPSCTTVGGAVGHGTALHGARRGA
jgi:hypothetical protein